MIKFNLNGTETDKFYDDNMTLFDKWGDTLVTVGSYKKDNPDIDLVYLSDLFGKEFTVSEECDKYGSEMIYIRRIW
jgi:hypothetical protein